MFRKLILLTFFLIPLLQFSQDFSELWEGHFSYNNISEVVHGNNKIYASAENAIFSYDTVTNELEKITTINGLSGENINTINYSKTFELLIVGYENGLIEILFDNDDDVLSVVDIIEKPTILPANRGINHFNIIDNLVYIATDYGISVYDLERLEFGDTYFIGNSGEQIQVTQTTVLNDFIYASCLGNNGIRKAQVSNPNIIDFSNWQTISAGNFRAIESISNQLYTIRANRKIYRIVSDTLVELFTYPIIPESLKAVEQNLIVVLNNTVYIYDENFNPIIQASTNSEFNTKFTSATLDLEYIYVGTTNFGVLKASLDNPTIYEEIRPDGPLLNIPFALQAGPNNLWVTFGEHDLFLNPYPLNSRGISHLKDEEWVNTPFNNVLGARSLKPISINPFMTSQVLIGSYIDGLLEVNDEIPTVLYNQNNSGLEYLISPNNPNYIGDIRVSTSVFDNNGLLWTLTNFVDPALKTYNPSNNQWTPYSIEEVVPKENNGYNDIVIGNDETKWIATYEYGLIGFNENNNSLKRILGEESNLPTEYVTALAMDNRNQLWIGTFKGLRVLYNTTNFFDEEFTKVDEVIILEDGIAKELLFEQFITDIKVDGSNNKWIGTNDSGLFYFSSDGQETIFHFTKDNSPLPSNRINDISIDSSSGTVYIATGKGLVSFRAGGSNPFQDLEKAFVYPNPVRPRFNIVDKKVKIKDISENVNIKITDIEGNLVAEAQSRTNQRYNGFNLEIDGGTAYWNGKNLANNIVASGVYLIMLSDLDTFETKVLKLMVVR
ncbi:two-component regulator propeller domain-containing protein [uncultured Algibacter sp.]|uniref:type IX secretion system anionic LPS delivery protein PorZ n=1 Tax=uncultured Algibacter sp. TaxID=298659 RepID=UPI002626850B|nr:two-component regulator propeller domain-containing protein [uncultured Algibacter sp.]